MKQSDKSKHLLSLIRSGEPMTLGQRLRLVVYLSVPAIIAQLSSIVMQYIDASMVGSLGAEASASIGLVSTTTWLFGGLCSAASTGFTVQVAHRIGAGDMQGARAVLRQSFTAIVIWGLAVSVLGMSISAYLPYWLGGDLAIRHDASLYFFIFSLFLPALQLSFLASGMLRCSGNMHVASLLGVSMCVLDVLLNFFLIFPTRCLSVGGYDVHILGAGLGVGGAALGTVVAESLVAAVMLWYLWYRSPELSLAKNKGCFRPKLDTIRKANGHRAYHHLLCTNNDYRNRSAVRHLCDSSQFVCHNGREPLLYARLWHSRRSYHFGRAELWCRKARSNTQLCLYNRLYGHGRNECNGRFDVCFRSTDNRHYDPR